MALQSPSVTIERLRGSGAPVRGRGRPQMVTLRRTAYVACVIEGQALAQEVMASAERIQTFAATGSRALVINEAGRIGHKAQAAHKEFRRLAADCDCGDAA